MTVRRNPGAFLNPRASSGEWYDRDRAGPGTGFPRVPAATRRHGPPLPVPPGLLNSPQTSVPYLGVAGLPFTGLD
jgi:hypothetical protein